MSTITPQQQQAITDLLAAMTLPSGLGTKESACSIAAINLALTGTLTDDIPGCMSLTIGHWIIGIQDAMPADMRNSAAWKALLPLAAGTGRDHEDQRLQLIMEWMWETALPLVQPAADRDGFGAEWRQMLRDRTPAAARAAEAAADAAYVAANAAAKVAEWAAEAAANAARAAEAANAAADDAWQQFNPCGLLQRLINVA